MERIILVTAIISFGILPAAVVMIQVSNVDILLQPQPPVGDEMYPMTTFEYNIAYDKWKKCVQEATLSASVCGSPPVSPFNYKPVQSLDPDEYDLLYGKGRSEPYQGSP